MHDDVSLLLTITKVCHTVVWEIFFIELFRNSIEKALEDISIIFVYDQVYLLASYSRLIKNRLGIDSFHMHHVFQALFNLFNNSMI